LPPAGKHQKAVELLQQWLRSTLFVGQAFPLSAPNLPANAVFVESPEKILQAGLQVQPVQAEALGLAQAWETAKIYIDWPHLDVLPSIAFPTVTQRPPNAAEFFGAVNQWLAMVGEWQGDEPTTRELTIDAASNDTVGQLTSWRTRGQDKRLISISQL
jgi:hypothetical protein